MQKRRKMGLKVGIGFISAAAIALAACSAPAEPRSGPGRSGRVTVKAMVLLNPADKVIAEKVLPEFERSHPEIKVQWEMVPYAGGYVQKAQLALANDKAPFDIIMWWDQLIPTAERFLEPLNSYIEESKFDMADFDPAWRDPAMSNGQTYGIPFVADMWTFWYRRDLLAQKKLKVPSTTEELLSSCRSLTDRGKKQYGYVPIGSRDPLQVMSWLPLLWAQGGEVFDRSWSPQLDSAAGIAAGTYWKQLSECAPPGAENYLNTDAITAFATGNAVMGTMGIGWIGAVQQQSPQMAAKINFGGRIPGTGAPNHLAHGWPFVIAKASQNKQAAWTFLSYLTSAKSFKEISSQPAGSHVVMARKSVYSDAAIEKVHPWIADVRKVVPYVRPKFNPELGNPPGWTKVMDEIALRNSQIMAGEKSPEAAYKEADAALDSTAKELKLTK